ncbi:unnamed protein product [Chironomus riparius]|uniref:snRNA-activating protein complex subunit 3 n=1 Tax=Chironomus riparius TaxID=315576 RepID=A0A9N9WTP3_9DIPT|nr:unnamed protein product [Chironomus riparius]
MDHVYPTKDYTEYVIKESMNDLKDLVINSEMPKTFDEIAETLNITEEELRYKSLEICKLYEDYGKDKACDSGDEFSDFSEDALELNCVKFLRKESLHFKDVRYKESNLMTKRKEVDIENADMEAYSDSIISIRFYDSFKYTPCVKNHPRFNNEYTVLGSNLLTELRDIFYCSCNFGPFFDISDYPTAKIIQEENAPNPGFFFIHDTFYNDTRNPDYSASIIKWMSKFHYTRDFKTANMQDIKFEDLKIRIGYPNVYQHHGACEHLFCITSVDLIDSSETLNRSEYPKISLTSNKRSIQCDICNKAEAEYIVTNCPLHVQDPTRLCETCFFSYHYIDRTTKTCEFNAYKMYSPNPGNFEIVTESIEEFELIDPSTM